MTAKVTRAAFPGHAITRPARWEVPVVFGSPHSGREYPARFLADSILDLRELRKSEDAYVDLLVPDPDAAGIPMLRARFPRAFIDVNRGAREVDEYMFTATPIQGAEVRSSRVVAGFGVIPRYAAEGRAIYAKKLSPTEGRLRLKWCYEPYHAAMHQLIDECRRRFGAATFIDWHSMPSSSATGRPLADIVLGDRFGITMNSESVDRWQRAFEGAGFSVARNAPYAGGQITASVGDPARGVDAMQIEINRALYLDEDIVQRRPQPFTDLQDRLRAVVADATQAAPPASLAAE